MSGKSYSLILASGEATDAICYDYAQPTSVLTSVLTRRSYRLIPDLTRAYKR